MIDLRETLRSAVASMLDRKARVALNAIATAIGTGAVVLLVSLGTGARDEVLREFQGIGSGIVVAFPGHTETLGFSPMFAGNTMPITVDDSLYVARHVPSVIHMNPVAIGSARVEHKPRGRNVQVAGVTSEWIKIWNVDLTAGSFIPAMDLHQGPRIACLGQKLARELFLDESPLGRFVRIGGTSFRVIGIVSKSINMGLDLNDMAFIPIDRGMRLYDLRGVSSLELSVGTGGDARATKSEVTVVLSHRHRDHQDFTVVSQDDLLETLSGVLAAITTGLSAIAAISLIVSGVGIANTMFVTVNERRGEVGLKLALGAAPLVVMVEFLIEAISIAGMGAFAGLGGALLIARAVGKATLGTPAPAPLWIVFVAGLVAVVLGVGAGILPAYRASKIPPAEALREE